MYFHTDSSSATELIAKMALRAALENKRLRIYVDGNGTLKIKVGAETWSAPVYSTPDPYRSE